MQDKLNLTKKPRQHVGANLAPLRRRPFDSAAKDSLAQGRGERAKRAEPRVFEHLTISNVAKSRLFLAGRTFLCSEGAEKLYKELAMVASP